MSDNYKVIRQIKKVSIALRSRGWSNNSIINEIGISHGLFTEIMEYDAVSVKVQETTLEKMREFLTQNEAGLEPPVRKKPGPKQKKPVNEFPINIPESMKDAIPADTAIKRNFENCNGLLAELSELATKFARQGYRLDASLTMMHTP